MRKKLKSVKKPVTSAASSVVFRPGLQDRTFGIGGQAFRLADYLPDRVRADSWVRLDVGNGITLLVLVDQNKAMGRLSPMAWIVVTPEMRQALQS